MMSSEPWNAIVPDAGTKAGERVTLLKIIGRELRKLYIV